MKKAIVLILSFLYLASSVGATVHLHYCMDKLVESSLFEKESTCSNCGMEESEADDGCCKEKQQQVKLDSDQKTVEQFQFSFALFSSLFVVTPFEFQLAAVTRVPHSIPYGNAPPERSTQPLFLLIRTLRI